MTDQRKFRILAVGVALMAAFLAGFLPGDGVRATSANRAAINLLDPAYPPVVAGPGWQYHEAAEADLDGDGSTEVVSVIARATWNGNSFDFDDGQPWQVYVTEADGKVTHLFSQWVQFGEVEVYVSEDGGKASVLLLVKQYGSIALYRLYYGGPGSHRSLLIGSAGFTKWTNRR